MAARSCASLVTRPALSPPTASSPATPGFAACSRASRCSGTLVGDVIVVAAPGMKLSPVITPPALTVTSAVACCHHGFLTERTGTTSPLRRLQSFSGYLMFFGMSRWFLVAGLLVLLVGQLPGRRYPPDGRLCRIACTRVSPGL